MNAAHVPCGHCGLPVRRAVPASGDGPFCCTGCELAWHFGDAGEGGSDRWIARIVLSAFLAMGVMVASLALYGRYLGEDGLAQSSGAIALRDIYRTGALLLCLPILHLLGVPLLGAVRASQRFLSADFLVLCGVGAAFSLSIWNTVMGRGEVYYETVAMVLVLVSLGRWLDARAKAKASAHLALIAPEAIANVTRIDMGGESSIAYGELQVGDSIRVRPGETLPVDGLVLRGETTLDTSSLTGEWLPRRVAKGDRVLAGCEVLDGTLVVRAEAVGAGRVQAEVERLLRAALDRPAHFVKLADRVAAVLLPIVFVLATGTLIWNLRLGRVEEGWMNALSVVLISCPCALGIATPLAYWTALREAWERGVLVKNAEVLERLARTEQVVFDKTGTLTSSAADLIRIHVADGDLDEAEALRLAAAVEIGSEHPIGRSLRQAWRERAAAGAELPDADSFRLVPGRGVEARIQGVRYRVVRSSGSEESEGTLVALEREGEVLAEFVLAARVLPAARMAVESLRRRGLRVQVMTGDALGPALALGADLQVTVEAELLPAEKVAALERMGVRSTVFVGDGINDAAALAASDVGIAVAGGSPRSIDAADVYFVRPGVEEVPLLLDLARRAVRTARANLTWAFAYNGFGLWLAATGRLTPVFAAAAMAASSVIVVLNSARGIPRRAAGEAQVPAPKLGLSAALSDAGS